MTPKDIITQFKGKTFPDNKEPYIWLEERINYLLKDQKETIQTLIAREIAIAHKEGEKTSRLTSLSVKINKL